MPRWRTPLRLGKRDLSRVAFQLSTLFLVFVAGAAVDRYHIFPYSLLHAGVASLKPAFLNLARRAGLEPLEFVRPARYEGDGVTRDVSSEVVPGLTFMAGFFDGGTEMRLLRPDGTIVRRWPVRVFDIFHDFKHIEPAYMAPKTNANAEINGAIALPDGSVAFNFGGVGMVKLDRCGRVMWTLAHVTHHSVSPTERGGFWVASQRFVGDESQFPLLRAPYTEETVLEVTADGKVLREISVLDIFFKNNLQALLLANGLKGVALANPYPEYPNTITHLNDVEELSSAMAINFPEFQAGDLLISLRSLNMVLVADPRDEKIKWYQIGPWLRQHDPDFEPDGRIHVLSNNDDGSDAGDILGGSTIEAVDPRTGDTLITYGTKPNQRMYTDIMGKHQALQNGHRLITEARAGRVFEIDSNGKVVWEYINRYDKANVAVVSDALRYPDSYFTVTDWTCP